MLDFIGNQHRRFRFDLRYLALTGATRGELAKQAAEGFPFLPSGCHVELDRVASGIVLDNLRQQLHRSRRDLVADLRRLGDVTLRTFLAESEVALDDLYAANTAPGWTALRRAAGLPAPPAGPDEIEIARAIGRLLHVSDPERLDRWRDWISERPSLRASPASADASSDCSRCCSRRSSREPA